MQGDTKLTSDHLRSMQKMRQMSIDRVALTELRADESRRDLETLQSLMRRGDQVEKKRIERLKSKEEVLRTLVMKDTSSALEEMLNDPKDYLRHKVSTVMIEVIKGSTIRNKEGRQRSSKAK